MSINTNFTNKLPVFILSIARTLLGIFLLTGIQAPLRAQESSFTEPVWWFGTAAAANINFHRGSTQQLNSKVTSTVAFHNSNSAGLYVVAPLVEYHRPDSRWGIMLQGGFDSRRGVFQEAVPNCNCPVDLSVKLNYFSIEPSLRLTPFKSGFYVYGGPRVAFNIDKSFIYNQEANPAIPEQVTDLRATGDLSNIHKTIVSMQFGAGYDIMLSPWNDKTQIVFSPFVSFQPDLEQSPRSIETWSISTLRVGAVLKFGVGKDVYVPVLAPPAAVVEPMDENVQFSVNSPKNIPAERKVRETFPLRNYVFFNKGSTEIPDRYVLLGKDQVKDFKEDQLEGFAPKNLSARSVREMTVYYNILNILGDRMQKSPFATITLVGSSEQGPEDGKAMAESIKRYLTNIFGIDAMRIGIQGRTKPKIPSEQPGGTLELDLLREGDQRVSIESVSPALLMEFQSGTDAPLKPVEIRAVQTAPLDSYVSFSVPGGKAAYTSWSLEIKDEQGALRSFGPYTQENVRIPGKAILGTRPEGDYTVTMRGVTKTGKQVTKVTNTHMVLWTPPVNEESMRFSIIFEFNESKAIAMYEKYLSDIVAPKIPKGAMVFVHGYTDIIGDATNNQKLSLARADEVKSILETSLFKSGRSDVIFKVYGFGEDEILAPFDNKFPEERFYNRTVIIDIVPID